MSKNTLYFVHDLDDPAVARRVRMLLAGWGRVELTGFHRGRHPVSSVNGIPATGLGRTEPAKLLSRALSVAKTAFRLKAVAGAVQRANVIIARNLEMLTLAVCARTATRRQSPLCTNAWTSTGSCYRQPRPGAPYALSRTGYGSRPTFCSQARRRLFATTSTGAELPGARRLVENKVLSLDGETALQMPKRPAPLPPLAHWLVWRAALPEKL